MEKWFSSKLSETDNNSRSGPIVNGRPMYRHVKIIKNSYFTRKSKQGIYFFK